MTWFHSINDPFDLSGHYCPDCDKEKAKAIEDDILSVRVHIPMPPNRDEEFRQRRNGRSWEVVKKEILDWLNEQEDGDERA